MDRFISLIIFLALVSPLSYAGEPERDKGISVHALPKRVADLSGKPWGFQVRYGEHLKPEPGQPYLQSLSDVLEYVNKQEQTVIDNGLWVVTTHPSSYSDSEKELQNKVKAELPKNNIPLYWVRGSQLKSGFKRY